MDFDVVYPRRAAHSDRIRDWAAIRLPSVASIAVVSAAAVYGVVFAGAAILHYAAFRSAHNDLGTMAQAVWSTAHGHFLEMTTQAGRQTPRLSVHVEPILVLFVPLWLVWGSPLLLVVVQALAVASGALPVYWLGRKHLGSTRAAVHFALAYLLFPATQFNAFTISSGFHAVALAVPLILFAIWFLDEDRLVLFGLFAVLAASTKEEIPVAVGCLGIWYAVRRGRRVFGAVTFSLGLAATAFDFLVVIPHFSPSGVDPFAGRYKQVGSTPTGILHQLVSGPAAVVHDVATVHKLVYLLLLLGPFLALWLLEPLLLLGAIPDLAINMLSSKSDQTSVAYHWTAGIVPFVVAASVLGAARLCPRVNLVSFCALIGVACSAIYSPLLALPGDIRALDSPTHAAKAHALHMIPAEARISASNQLGASLSTRRYSFTFPTIGSARWIVIDKADPTYRDEHVYSYAVRTVEASSMWTTVYASHGIAVLHATRR